MEMEKRREVLLITGATKGIGRAIAERAVMNGWEVVGMARSADPSFPGALKLVDLLDERARRKLFDEVVQEFRITRLVNNAGMNRLKPVSKVTKEDFETIMALNVTVPYELTQAVLPGMILTGYGRIVNIASRAILGRPGSSVYSTAKAGIVGLTRTLSLELAHSGVTVNAISPGPIATEMFFSNNPPESLATKALIDSIPMKRMGLVQEVAAAACYFLSDDASFTTGQNLFVCGGASVGKIPL
jgi:NAD(P)-dependent dehydrogenase (short-subunit alcohol dehydrogenase family)